MSWNPALDPSCPTGDAVDAIETLIIPRARDLGDFEVRRALPAPKRQMVGPFIFFDQAGPAEFLTGQGVDVRPHPHIGLATVTYLFKGEFQHRDSLGSDQIILPGAVNWMIAGKGVTHSERTSAATRQHPHSLFGIQTWVALPERSEDTEAGFEHQAKEALPFLDENGATRAADPRHRLGRARRRCRPSRRCSMPMSSSSRARRCRCRTATRIAASTWSRAASSSAGETYEAARMMTFRPGDRLHVTAGPQGARLMLLGGETLGGPRYIWWNFVASSKERIEAAKEAWRAGDWEHGRFQLPPGDDAEFIPLPP